MTDTPPATPPATPPGTPPPESSPTDDELAGLDERARRLIDRANAESAGRRHERDELRAELEKLQREHESVQERRDREAYERGQREGVSEIQKQLDDAHRANLTLQITGWIADKVIDPDVVIGLLPLDVLRVIDDLGERRAAVDRAVDELLRDKAYLAKANKPPLVTQGARSAGQPNGRPRERSWLRG
jgi:hypothetical protein